MKKIWLLILLLLCCSLIGCTSSKYIVNFFVEEQLLETIIVPKSQKVKKPVDPDKLYHQFAGWYTDDNERYDFNDKVINDINLFAKFDLQYEEIINQITMEDIKTSVQVINKTYNKNFLGFETNIETSYGSGTIFSLQNNTYYLLTNNHVVYCQKSYQDISIIDYLGNSYKGVLLDNSAQNKYDLAIISFTKIKQLKTISLALKNPHINEEVIALGFPGFQSNAITIGKVISYKIVQTKEDLEKINIEFPILYHDAPTAKGSSGGMLLNSQLELVGIHFAGSDEEGFSYMSCAVPIEKIQEYINYYFIL